MLSLNPPRKKRNIYIYLQKNYINRYIYVENKNYAEMGRNKSYLVKVNQTCVYTIELNVSLNASI